MRGDGMRFKIVSRVMPHTGRRRWHLKAYRSEDRASTLTTRYTHAEAIEALDRLVSQ